MRMARAMMLVICFAPWATPSFGEAILGIDAFTTSQSVSVFEGSGTNTVATAGAIGGYRTLTITSAGNADVSSTLNVSSGTTNRLNLSSPTDATATFDVLWGGANGTAGLGGVDLTSGWPDLNGSSLQFKQRSADFASNFTWTFTDTANKTSSYTGSLPVKSSSTAATQFSIPFSSFTSQSGFDWTSINFIKFSGGNVLELDVSLTAPMQIVTVPEPSTYALAVIGAAAALAVARRKGA
jgi:hypothetical protein